MIDGLGIDKKATNERNSAIAGSGDKGAVEDFVICKGVEGTDSLMVKSETIIKRTRNGHIRRKYR
jgi:hypothetical protein